MQRFDVHDKIGDLMSLPQLTNVEATLGRDVEWTFRIWPVPTEQRINA